mmetsp:Transcript_3169/g.8420  ORF Transcript_3169/g.8420 Transcript_3169/m.8420 type:complete len:155 (-) Transcript_3169:811-1275(-)
MTATAWESVGGLEWRAEGRGARGLLGAGATRSGRRRRSGRLRILRDSHSPLHLHSHFEHRRRARATVAFAKEVEERELREIDSEWELETRPGLVTRLVVAVFIALAAVSGGTLLLRVLASIFAIFLSCVRYIFISAALLFVLSLLWNDTDAKGK